MSQQPVAFTFVKTVVTAREEGRTLDDNLATAWAMLTEELDPGLATTARTVAWGPNHQEELRRLIDGIRGLFDREAELQEGIATLLNEGSRLHEIVASEAERATDNNGTVPEQGLESESAVEADPRPEPEAEQVHSLEPAREPEESEPAPEITVAAPDENLGEVAEENLGYDIPMIVLDPDMEAAIEPATAAHEAAVPAALPPHATRIPESTPEPVEFQQRNATMPAGVAAETSSKLPLLLAGLGALLLLLGVLYLFWSRSTSQSNVLTETTSPSATTTTEAASSSVASATAPSVASLLTNGDLAGAKVAQRDYIVALEGSNAPPALRAEAFAILADLSIRTSQPIDAVAEQRRSLELTEEAHGENSVPAADAHLRLANNYVQTDERHMAEAHFRRGRKLLRDSSALSDDRAADIQQLADQLAITD